MATGQIAYQGSAFQGSLRCDDRVMLALIKPVGNVPISEVKFFRLLLDHSDRHVASAEVKQIAMGGVHCDHIEPGGDRAVRRGNPGVD